MYGVGHGMYVPIGEEDTSRVGQGQKQAKQNFPDFEIPWNFLNLSTTKTTNQKQAKQSKRSKQ